MEGQAIVVSGWRKGQRNPAPRHCRKCVFRAENDMSLSRFHCWAAVRDPADAGACAKRRLRPFPPIADQGDQR